MSTPEQDEKNQEKTLLDLGPGEGSKVERIKIASRYLHGQIAEELKQKTSHFAEDQVQLIKFHGMYQQEDRDVRQTRRVAGDEKAYQFMIRSRIPGGSLTAEQYLVHDDLCSQYGNQTLRITTRQGFQLHGVLKGDIRSTIQGINQSLLTTLAACGDVNRNVMACAAPISNQTQGDIQEIALKLALHLAPHTTAYHEIWIDGEKIEDHQEPKSDDNAEPMYGPTYLPRKFKVGISYAGDNCIDAYTQDIAFIAREEQDRLIGFTVVIGGGMGTTHGKKETHPLLAQPFADISIDQVLAVAETIVTVQRDYGDRTNRKHARMKYVVEEKGIPWFRAEVERRLGYPLSAPGPIHFHDADDHLGWHKQADENWFLGLHVENGRIKDTEQIRLKTGLRTVIEQFRPHIRLTGQQNILLTDISPAGRTKLEETLQTFGIQTDPELVGNYRFAMACPALPTCGLAVAEAERIFPEVVKQLKNDLYELGLGEEKISFRMTGCPNGCARPYLGDIGFVGRTKDMYHIYIGGDRANTRLNELYAESIKLQDLTTILHPLFMLWKNERRPQEGFGDYCHRIGVTELHEKVTSIATR